MTNFELFTLMFFALDSEYDSLTEKDSDLGQYLSEINPFLWKDCTSADPAHFAKFERFMKDKSIGKDYGYSVLYDFLQTENFYKGLPAHFLAIQKEDYIDYAKKYLSEPHKGGKN